MAQSKRPKSERDKHREEHSWPDNHTRANMPFVNWDFRVARDPYQEPQILAMQRTEKERRDESKEQSSKTIELEKPLELKTRQEIFRDATNEQIFSLRQLEAKREADFAEAKNAKEMHQRDRTPGQFPSHEQQHNDTKVRQKTRER